MRVVETFEVDRCGFEVGSPRPSGLQRHGRKSTLLFECQFPEWWMLRFMSGDYCNDIMTSSSTLEW